MRTHRDIISSMHLIVRNLKIAQTTLSTVSQFMCMKRQRLYYIVNKTAVISGLMAAFNVLPHTNPNVALFPKYQFYLLFQHFCQFISIRTHKFGLSFPYPRAQNSIKGKIIIIQNITKKLLFAVSVIFFFQSAGNVYEIDIRSFEFGLMHNINFVALNFN